MSRSQDCLSLGDPPALEAGEDPVAVGVEDHLEADGAPGGDHGPGGGTVAVPGKDHRLEARHLINLRRQRKTVPCWR